MSIEPIKFSGIPPSGSRVDPAKNVDGFRKLPDRSFQKEAGPSGSDLTEPIQASVRKDAAYYRAALQQVRALSAPLLPEFERLHADYADFFKKAEREYPPHLLSSIQSDLALRSKSLSESLAQRLMGIAAQHGPGDAVYDATRGLGHHTGTLLGSLTNSAVLFPLHGYEKTRSVLPQLRNDIINLQDFVDLLKHIDSHPSSLFDLIEPGDSAMLLRDARYERTAREYLGSFMRIHVVQIRALFDLTDQCRDLQRTLSTVSPPDEATCSRLTLVSNQAKSLSHELSGIFSQARHDLSVSGEGDPTNPKLDALVGLEHRLLNSMPTTTLQVMVRSPASAASQLSNLELSLSRVEDIQSHLDALKAGPSDAGYFLLSRMGLQRIDASI